jgi:hypothetical protein
MVRAKADEPNMGLTSWKGSVVRKQDVIVAKNYLTADELDSLNRLVVIFLEMAEFRAKNRQNLTMAYWKDNVDKILIANEQPLLLSKGNVSKEQMETFANAVYEDFNARRKAQDTIDADAEDMRELFELEQELKKR